MKTKIIAACSIAALLLVTSVLAKGGGRGGGGRGGSRGSSSRGSSSGSSWFSWGRSKPAASPSHSSPSYSSPSYKSPSPPSYGWNTGGAPPAYPGLQNKPVYNSHSPPAYSPSYSNPPGYSRYPNNYNSYTRTHNYQPPNYGSQFGSSGVGHNTYIHNNYYGGGSYGNSGSGSNFLTNALFYSAGRHHGYSMGRPVYYGSGGRSWSERQDREWRETTQAPYFENKVPGGESVLPAAAVIGAATAFGLTTLLPLNVPSGKPLMYCNSSFIEQNPIEIDDNTYSCLNGSIAVSCPRTDINGTSFDECLSLNQTLQCDLLESSENIFCSNGTLLSRSPIYCKTTSQFNITVVVNGTSVNETETVLNCRVGEWPKNSASYIPTTSTEAPIATTSEKSLSLEARMHVFFLLLIGNSHVLETTTTAPSTTTSAPLQLWIPEALTIPPEPTTTTTTTERTTTEPYYWAYKIPSVLSNGTWSYKYTRAPDYIGRWYETAGKGVNDVVFKVSRSYFDTTEEPQESSTVTTEDELRSSTDSADLTETSTSAQETSTIEDSTSAIPETIEALRSSTPETTTDDDYFE